MAIAMERFVRPSLAAMHIPVYLRPPPRLPDPDEVVLVWGQPGAFDPDDAEQPQAFVNQTDSQGEKGTRAEGVEVEDGEGVRQTATKEYGRSTQSKEVIKSFIPATYRYYGSCEFFNSGTGSPIPPVDARTTSEAAMQLDQRCRAAGYGRLSAIFTTGDPTTGGLVEAARTVEEVRTRDSQIKVTLEQITQITFRIEDFPYKQPASSAKLEADARDGTIDITERERTGYGTAYVQFNLKPPT